MFIHLNGAQVPLLQINNQRYRTRIIQPEYFNPNYVDILLHILITGCATDKSTPQTTSGHITQLVYVTSSINQSPFFPSPLA